MMQRDDALHDDERDRLQAPLDAAGVGTWRYDLDTDLMELDARAQEHYGLTRGALPLADFLARVHPDDRPRLEGEIATALRAPALEHVVSEYRTLDAAGRVRHLRVHVRFEFNAEAGRRRQGRAFGVTQDVTAAHADRRLLEDQAVLLHEVEQIAQVGGWDFDPRTREGRWTAGTLAIHGLTEPPSAAPRHGVVGWSRWARSM